MIDAVIVAALVNGNDVVGVIDAMIDHGVGHADGGVPVHERDHVDGIVHLHDQV